MDHQQPQWLSDQPLLGDAIRVVTIVAGFILFAIAIRLAARRLRGPDRDPQSAFGFLSFGLFAITPSISGLFRFNGPLNLYTTLTYLAGLACGIIAAAYWVTLRSAWWTSLRLRRSRHSAERKPRR